MTTEGRRVAFLTHTPPRPLVSGERIRSWHLVRELARRGFAVSLFSLAPSGAPPPSSQDRALLEETCASFTLVPFDSSSIRRRVRLLADVALRRPFHAGYFADPRAVEACHAWIGDAFDAVVVSQLYMAPYVPRDRYARVVFDSHNAEVRRLQSMEAVGSTARGAAARLQRGPVAHYEREIAGRSARVVAVSDAERAYFEELAPGRVDLVPNGVDCAALRLLGGRPREPQLLFVGSLDYSANVDAMGYLGREILPRLAPEVRVDVVGSNPRRAAVEAARAASMTLVGYVEDTTPYWNRARVFVVPLRVGGGTRLKILESLARGVPVVSTSIGCEGLGLRHGEDLLVADDPGEFAACVGRLLADDDLCRRLAAAGRETVEARFDWPAIGEAFAASVTSVLRP